MIDFYSRKFRRAIVWAKDSADAGQIWAKSTGEECGLQADAEIVTSEIGSGWRAGMHAPVIDLDMAHHYEPSTTPGHGHLYLNQAMSFEAMTEILDVLAKHGVVQSGFRDATKQRGWAAVRTPWTRKAGF